MSKSKKRKAVAPDLETIIPLLIRQWRQMHELSGPDDKLQTREFRSVVDRVVALQKGLKEGESLAGHPYFDDKMALGAYLLYHWPIHYQEALALIGELPTVPRRVWDLCAGPLPMAFAALRHGAEEVVATDIHFDAMSLGAQICGKYGYPVRIRRWDALGSRPPVEGLFDLIIVGHALAELFPSTEKGWNQQQEAFINTLFRHLSPDGYILVVEGSFAASNRRILDLRDRLVEKGISIQAPCIWTGKCPANGNQLHPCYAQREMEKPFLIKEIQRSAEINLSSLKMSYLIFCHPERQKKSHGEGLYRVISPPIEGTQGTRFYLCGTDGHRYLESRNKVQTEWARPFDFLKRGELIQVENALSSGKQLLIDDETSVKVVAALNKPVPENSEICDN